MTHKLVSLAKLLIMAQIVCVASQAVAMHRLLISW